MRVLMINQVFYPDVAATAQHGHDLARYLVAQGHEVTAIASRSLYGQKGAALPSKETVDGIHIRRVGRSFFGKSSIIARLADFVYFYIAATLRALFLPRHDVVICFTTPPFISLSGRIIRFFKRSKMVYWVMDLYPDAPIAVGVMREVSLASRFFEWVNRSCLKSSDMNVVLGRCMRERVLAKGVDPKNVALIGVWSDQEEVHPVPREENTFRKKWDVGDRMLVMYSGNLGLGHDVSTFLESAKALRNDDRIRFAFVGGGKKKAEVEAYVHEHSLESTCILAPYQPREELDELLSAADAHLVSLLEGAEGIMVPCKLFGILAAARPTLFIGSAKSEIALVIEENSCGKLVRQGDSESLTKAITEYASNPTERMAAGDRARTAIVEHHSMQQRCEAWRTLLEGLV